MSLLSLLDEPAPTEEPRTPCAACGREGLHEHWGTMLCAEHSGAWFSDPRFDAGKVIPEVEPAAAAAVVLDRYRKLTAAWLREQRGGVA